MGVPRLITLMFAISCGLPFAFAQASQSAPFSLSINAPHTVKAGSAAPLEIALTNNTESSISLVRASPSLDYKIVILDSAGNALESQSANPPVPNKDPFSVGRPWIGSREQVVLQAGETYTEEALLGRLYDLNQPGQYTIQVSRHIPFAEAGGPGDTIEVQSNKILLTVAASHAQDPAPFSFSISTLENPVKVGAPVRIQTIATNTSQTVVDLIITDNDKFDFGFDVRDSHGSALPQKRNAIDPRFHLDGMPDEYPEHLYAGFLEPGQAYREEIRLDQLYDLSQPGTYSVEISRYAERNHSRFAVESNTITIMVTP